MNFDYKFIEDFLSKAGARVVDLKTGAEIIYLSENGVCPS